MDFDINDSAPEHKSGIVARGDYDDFRATFEEFKSANDERLARLEKKRGDVLLEEKVDRINAALDAQHKRMDELALKHARPALDGRARIVSDAAGREHKGAFEAYVRGGEAGALRELESKAMSVWSATTGSSSRCRRMDQAGPRRSISIGIPAISHCRAGWR